MSDQPPSWQQLTAVGLASGLPFVVFGILDNGIMVGSAESSWPISPAAAGACAAMHGTAIQLRRLACTTQAVGMLVLQSPSSP